jgi:arsenate reductase (thioredoxin)
MNYYLRLMKSEILTPIREKIEQFEKDYALISEGRKQILRQLAAFVTKKLKTGQSAELNFICTHNSRRSHISQIWAQAAAAYYHVENVQCYSGGTEATAFNPRAVRAMSEVGFRIVKEDETENPRYSVHFAESQKPLIAFSKVYSDPFNPSTGYAAIMTCSHADENCPLVIGAETRISLPFNDPKDFDGTPQEAVKYHERVLEIGREICYAFSQVNA